ncbi:MAG: hypothetical protein ACWGP1_16275 [Syntrophobacteria bacterium]
MVNELAYPNCDVTVCNLNEEEGVDELKAFDVTTLPAVLVNGKLL